MKFDKTFLKQMVLYLLAAAAGAFGYSTMVEQGSITISVPTEQAAPAQDPAPAKAKAKAKAKAD